MLHIPRFTRLLLLALLLVIVPSVYFFYPGAQDHVHSKLGLDAGGIDSEHVREKVPPVLEEEEARDWDQWGAQVQDLPKEAAETTTVTTTTTVHETATTPVTPVTETAQTTTTDAATDKTSSFLKDVNGLGSVIMPKLGNATAKAELGRATWRFLHTMTLRFPDKPTKDDREALVSFFHLFSRLYPCGECAEHFQGMLKEYPVQSGSRKSASLWLCHLHNIVNERLHKPEFDCLTLDATYDCGCGNETTTAVPGAAKTAPVGKE